MTEFCLFSQDSVRLETVKKSAETPKQRHQAKTLPVGCVSPTIISLPTAL